MHYLKYLSTVTFLVHDDVFINHDDVMCMAAKMEGKTEETRLQLLQTPYRREELENLGLILSSLQDAKKYRTIF